MMLLLLVLLRLVQLSAATVLRCASSPSPTLLVARWRPTILRECHSKTFVHDARWPGTCSQRLTRQQPRALPEPKVHMHCNRVGAQELGRANREKTLKFIVHKYQCINARNPGLVFMLVKKTMFQKNSDERQGSSYAL